MEMYFRGTRSHYAEPWLVMLHGGEEGKEKVAMVGKSKLEDDEVAMTIVGMILHGSMESDKAQKIAERLAEKDFFNLKERREFRVVAEEVLLAARKELAASKEHDRSGLTL